MIMKKFPDIVDNRRVCTCTFTHNINESLFLTKSLRSLSMKIIFCDFYKFPVGLWSLFNFFLLGSEKMWFFKFLRHFIKCHQFNKLKKKINWRVKCFPRFIPESESLVHLIDDRARLQLKSIWMRAHT